MREITEPIFRLGHEQPTAGVNDSEVSTLTQQIRRPKILQKNPVVAARQGRLQDDQFPGGVCPRRQHRLGGQEGGGSLPPSRHEDARRNRAWRFPIDDC